MESLALHAGLIMLLAVVQSMFGMGILVFGTPTLLLLGVDFTTVLGLLLPSSITISAIQVLTSKQIPWVRREKLNMVLCALCLISSLVLLIRMNWKAHIDIWIGLTMLTAAALRYWRALQQRMQVVLARWQSAYIVFMGLVHGLTNMGGALLALYATSAHKDKLLVRTTVARYYLMFGLLQLGTLAVLKPAALSVQGLFVAPVAALSYLVAGNLLFKRTSAPVYERSITLFIAVYGLAIIAKAQY